jgi:murein DD-endopeptidase MepM/ murein hydrolase activator NlpD
MLFPPPIEPNRSVTHYIFFAEWDQIWEEMSFPVAKTLTSFFVRGIITKTPEDQMNFGWRRLGGLVMGVWLALAGCGQARTGVIPQLLTPPSLPTFILLPTVTQAPTVAQLPTVTESAALQPSPTPAPTETTPAFSVCSPLNGVSIADLPGAVSNPYHPPIPGRDDPHAGVDLADRQPRTQIALAGREVDAVLTGRVSAAIKDRFPFGNAVIVETSLSTLPGDFLSRLALPAVQDILAPPGPLTCPAVTIPPAWDFTNPSLYLLYAHMQSAPEVRSGDAVGCGQRLGQVGQTGNALNPHLHLEIRAGPGRASFSSLAHYTDSASPEEMRNYCAWSVSGLFQLADPLGLFR